MAQLHVSPRTEHKLRTKHQLDWRDVVRAVQAQPALRFRWHDHRERGLRAILEVEVDGSMCLVVLYPKGDDEYHLGSAYRT